MWCTTRRAARPADQLKKKSHAEPRLFFSSNESKTHTRVFSSSTHSRTLYIFFSRSRPSGNRSNSEANKCHLELQESLLKVTVFNDTCQPYYQREFRPFLQHTSIKEMSERISCSKARVIDQIFLNSTNSLEIKGRMRSEKSFFRHEHLQLKFS